jgi:hypothetical protein
MASRFSERIGRADDVIADEGTIIATRALAEMIPNRSCDEGLDLVCRYATDSSGFFCLALHES